MVPSAKKVIKVLGKLEGNVPLEVFKKPYEVLVSTMLSSRTNDDTTLPVAKRLLKVAPNPEALSRLSEKQLERLIYPVGFYKTKARHLKKLALLLTKEYSSQVPSTREGLMKLPGVGRKTANLVLTRAFDKQAISVDTHVHKISNLLGWVSTKTPEQTELELMKVVPKKHWKDINRLMVTTGRTFKTKGAVGQFLKQNGLLK